MDRQLKGLLPAGITEADLRNLIAVEDQLGVYLEFSFGTVLTRHDAARVCLAYHYIRARQRRGLEEID